MGYYASERKLANED